MYRLLAIAKYEDRYVMPTAHSEVVGTFLDELPGCSVDWSASGEGSLGEARPVPVTIESFHLTKARMDADTHADIEGQQ